MTSEQAEEWAGLTGIGVAETPLEVAFSSVLCAVCLEHYGDALPTCLGAASDDQNEHVWQAFFTSPATDEDAETWAAPDGEYRPGRPQAVAVMCVLCGQGPDAADPECRERTLWNADSTLDIEPDDFEGAGATTTGGTVPVFQGCHTDEPPMPELDVEMLLIERPIDGDCGGWHVAGALTRTSDGDVSWVADRIDPTYTTNDVRELWEYLTDTGANGISWEVACVRIASPADADAVARYVDDLLREHGHPLGI